MARQLHRTKPTAILADESIRNTLELPTEERLFNSLDTAGRGYIVKKQFINALKNAGIDAHHLSLQPMFKKLHLITDDAHIFLEDFTLLTKDAMTLIEKTLTGGLIIPNFSFFCEHIDDIYHKVAPLTEGKVADYIPQLSRVNPDMFAVSVCTIHGQMYSIGDSEERFSAQSTCKPVNYCLIQKEHGEELVHKYIGKEPSGHRFNIIRLNKDNRPHNPFINAGAIMACSLIQRDMSPADRFDYMIHVWENLCGGLKPGFNNAIYLSERNTADRNFAIAHFMREKNAFPKDTNMMDVLEFYFQCCSIEITSRHLSIVAATMANAGICPLTQMQIFDANTVKNCLSLMHSCGLYESSGEFAFTVGLPAKSGVSGPVMLVIPNVLGMCIWSPRVDAHGNSVRGIAYCNELVKKFNFHTYDTLVRSTDKLDPRLRKNEIALSGIMSLIWAASQGDLIQIEYLIAHGVDINQPDYDGRTALHLAASEGQEQVVRYLLHHKAKINPIDRWGGTPLTDALRCNHQSVVALLKKYNAK